MDSVQLIAVFLFIIVVELAVLIYLYASTDKVSSFANRSKTEIMNLWKDSGCNKNLTDLQLNNFVNNTSRLSNSQLIKNDLSRCLIEQQQKRRPLSVLDYLIPEHEKVLKNMWNNAGCGNKLFPAQSLNSIFKRQYSMSIDKNIIFESMKNWLKGEIEDMC